MDKGEGVRVNTPTREEQLYSKLNFERERSLKLNQYAIDLQNELKAEQQAHNALKEKLKELELVYDNGFPCCPACDELAIVADGKGHKEDCWLAEAIKGVE